jgi:hypothetical protein
LDNISAASDEKAVIAYVRHCRTQTLAAKPVLDDLHVRFQQFKTMGKGKK